MDEQFSKFLNIFKKLEINIPFADALAQISNYARFMKEIMSNKKKLDLVGKVSLFESCNAIIQRKLSKKLKDPSNFTIPCLIGEHAFKKALCDLGAIINLMPLSVAKKPNLGEPTPTTLSLLMVDRSMTYPQGIIKDVLVKVVKFIFLVDFVVLDMEEDKKVPLILGRPFMTIGQALIDVKYGELTLRMGDDQVKFNWYQNLKISRDDRATCMRIDSLIPSRDKLMHDFMDRDSLEECQVHSLSVEELKDEKVASNPILVETVLNLEEIEEDGCRGRTSNSGHASIERTSSTPLLCILRRKQH